MKVAWLLPEAWEHDAQAHGPGLNQSPSLTNEVTLGPCGGD